MNKNFRKFMKRNKISVEELARALGVTVYAIYSYEAERSKPSIKVIKKMNSFFAKKGISFDPFIYF